MQRSPWLRLIKMELLIVLLSLVTTTHLAAAQESTTQQDVRAGDAATDALTTYTDSLAADSGTNRPRSATGRSTTLLRNQNVSRSSWQPANGRDRMNFTHAIQALLVPSDPAEGQSMTLSCIVLDPRILTVSWYKNDRLTTHDMLATSADSQRMSVSHDIGNDSRRTFNLTIDFLRFEDGGRYSCRGVNHPEASASLDVNVRYVPELHYPECFMNGKRQTIVTEGEELRFECRQQMSQRPWHLIWFRQLNKSVSVISAPMHQWSDMIVSEHTVIATPDLNGAKFICSLVCLSADCLNSPGDSPKSCDVGPLIVTPPQPLTAKPIISIDPGIQIASEGDDVEFSCSTSLADGNAVWFPVGEEPPDDHIIVSDDGSQMAIKNVRGNDTDLMACGVFCQDKLITVEHVNMKVIRKEDTLTTTSPTPTVRTSISKTNFISPTIQTLMVRTTLNKKAGDTGRVADRGRSRRAGLIGAIVGTLILIIVGVIILVIKFGKGNYQRASTNDMQDHNVTV
ncbi:uncharacterized protein [Diadema antillarum]|uniref:uncharacterized protein isoform X1 n=2 Tax=Diadema antillarum TaxID=105358 RepID=UPI003A875938